MWPRFSLSASSGVVAGPCQHLWPLGAPMGAVSGAKSHKGEKTWPLHVPEGGTHWGWRFASSTYPTFGALPKKPQTQGAHKKLGAGPQLAPHAP